MRLASRLRSLEAVAERRRPPPDARFGMMHPDNELMSLVCADRGSALVVLNVRGWIECAARDTPEVRATIDRLMAVVNERLGRMRALGWPTDGLGDDPPEAHEEGPPMHLQPWYSDNRKDDA